MIRWRFLITRVLIVILVIVLVRWALGPAVRYAAVNTLQKATGGRIDIAQAHIDLWPPRIYFEAVQIADPSKEQDDAVRAELVDVRIKPSALLRREWVVESARITGLKLNQPRSTSGRLDTVPSVEPTGESFASKMSGILGTYAKDRASEFANNLETVKVSDQLRSHWENEYRTLTARAKGLEGSVREVRDGIRGIDNPLRDLPQVQEALRKSEAIRQELLVVRQTIDNLPANVQNDLGRLNQARQIDIQRVSQYIPTVDGEQTDFSPSMFREIVAAQLDRVRELLDGSRTVADWTVAAPKSQRTRGDDYNFLAGRIPPNWLVEQAEVSGVMQVDGSEYDLSGVFENITGEPLKAEGPLVARIKLDGPQTVRVDLQRHTEEIGTWDDVTMHWPQLPTGALAVGNPNDASIRMEPSALELWVQMKVQGDQVSGRMISKMRGTRITANIPSGKYNEALASSLTQSLQNIHEVNVEANFDGRWNSMKINVASNLSGVFSGAIRNSLDAQAIATKRQLTAKVENVYRDQMNELQGWMSIQQAEVRKALTQADTSVEEISQKLVNQLGSPDLYLGRLRRGFELPKF